MFSRKNNHGRKKILLVMLFSLSVFIFGCNLTREYFAMSESSGLNYDERRTIVAIIDEATSAVTTPNVEEILKSNSAQEYAFQMGVRCLDAPGEDPCPLEACIANADQYEIHYQISNELFGKANPDDYQCCADLLVTNNSSDNLLFWGRMVNDQSEDWFSDKIATNEVNFEVANKCSNNYSRNDGQETFVRGFDQGFMLYDNAHCSWVERGNADLQKYLVQIMSACGP